MAYLCSRSPLEGDGRGGGYRPLRSARRIHRPPGELRPPTSPSRGEVTKRTRLVGARFRRRRRRSPARGRCRDRSRRGRQAIPHAHPAAAGTRAAAMPNRGRDKRTAEPRQSRPSTCAPCARRKNRSDDRASYRAAAAGASMHSGRRPTPAPSPLDAEDWGGGYPVRHARRIRPPPGSLRSPTSPSRGEVSK